MGGWMGVGLGSARRGGSGAATATGVLTGRAAGNAGTIAGGDGGHPRSGELAMRGDVASGDAESAHLVRCGGAGSGAVAEGGGGGGSAVGGASSRLVGSAVGGGTSSLSPTSPWAAFRSLVACSCPVHRSPLTAISCIPG